MDQDQSKESQPPAPPRRRRRLLPRIALLFLVAVAGLYLMSFSAKAPDNLGHMNGHLADCPDSPNCVSTQADTEQHQMETISYTGSQADAMTRLKSVISDSFGRAKLVEEQDHYLRYEFTSLIFRFVDDVEFLFDDSLKKIHFRSASRVGHSDLGANRKRMQKIVDSFSAP